MLELAPITVMIGLDWTELNDFRKRTDLPEIFWITQTMIEDDRPHTLSASEILAEGEYTRLKEVVGARALDSRLFSTSRIGWLANGVIRWLDMRDWINHAAKIVDDGDKKTIFLEYPEAFLHPQLHLEVGQSIADLWLTTGRRFLVETHSENLILRLRKLVSKGVLKPEDLLILYFAGAGEPIEIRVTADGFLTPGLPMEFFGSSILEALDFMP